MPEAAGFGPNPCGARIDAPGSAEQARFQILALDGGGAKALFTAHVLARLEQDLRVRLVDAFDLIAGTSAGGIVALALGAGLAPRDIVSHYEDLAEAVFPRARRRPWRRIRQCKSPLYDAASLRAVLTDVLGGRKLGDSSKRLVVPAWDVGRGSVHVFKTPHHVRLTRDWSIPMVDIALATSAAPTFFPAARVDGHRLIDGGVWANNPSVIAIAEAVSMLNVPLSAIRVLNVGTTESVSHHPKSRDTGGFIQWARSIGPTLVEASSRGGQGTAEHLVSRKNFRRFDAVVPGGLYQLDSVNADDIAGLAASVSRELSPVYTEIFTGHDAPKFSPLVE
jgi:patatin-like phospholipase/acyl hydrolase